MTREKESREANCDSLRFQSVCKYLLCSFFKKKTRIKNCFKCIMNESHDQEERLLSRDQLETGSNNGENPAKNNSDSLKFCPLFIVSFLLLISLASNAIQSVYIKRLEKPQGCCASMYSEFCHKCSLWWFTDLKLLAGLRLDKAIPYELHNDYMNDNRNISDPLWAQLDSNPVAVALDRDFIRIHNLQQSTFCPRDHSKQLYQVKAFHHIHCLVSYYRPI